MHGEDIIILLLEIHINIKKNSLNTKLYSESTYTRTYKHASKPLNENLVKPIHRKHPISLVMYPQSTYNIGNTKEKQERMDWPGIALFSKINIIIMLLSFWCAANFRMHSMQEVSSTCIICITFTFYSYPDTHIHV